MSLLGKMDKEFEKVNWKQNLLDIVKVFGALIKKFFEGIKKSGVIDDFRKGLKGK